MLKWCKDNKLDLNVLKCAVLTMGRNENKLIGNYTMSDTAINRVKDFRDLGIIIDD